MRSEKSQLMRTLIDSPGFPVLLAHLDEEIKEGWDRFISLPVEQKTGKRAQEHQAKYRVLADLKDWLAAQAKA